MYEVERGHLDSLSVRVELSSLLPPNTTQIEWDIAAVSRRLTAFDYSLSTKLDPATCGMATLPWLAWGRSIDLWDDNWSDARKRSIVLKSHFLHSLKGTAKGIREHIRYTDTELVKIVAPPINAFATRTYTKAEREAWLSVMPQLRLYRFLDNGSSKSKSFCTRLQHPTRAFLGRKIQMPLTDAQVRIGTRGFFWDRGEQVPLTTARISKVDVTGPKENIFEVRRKGDGGLAIFPGGGRTFRRNKSILGGGVRSGGLYTVHINDAYSQVDSVLTLNTLQPSLKPVDTRFEYVRERGIGLLASMYPGKRIQGSKQVLHKRYLPTSKARERLYQRMYLFDPNRGVGLRQSRTFLGNVRLGIAAYTAELSIRIQNKRLKNSANDFVSGFLHKTPQTKLSAALRAVRIAKAARDKTLVRLGLYQRPRMSKGLPLDTDYRFGDRIRNY